MNSLIFLGVMVAMIMANVNQLTKVTAETGVGNDVFKVVHFVWNNKFNKGHYYISKRKR